MNIAKRIEFLLPVPIIFNHRSASVSAEVVEGRLVFPCLFNRPVETTVFHYLSHCRIRSVYCATFPRLGFI